MHRSPVCTQWETSPAKFLGDTMKEVTREEKLTYLYRFYMAYKDDHEGMATQCPFNRTMGDKYQPSLISTHSCFNLCGQFIRLRSTSTYLHLCSEVVLCRCPCHAFGIGDAEERLRLTLVDAKLLEEDI